MPNRLARETSPYLLQHANNPVDWYPWGDEALQKARDEDKPIFLSIGYSACHWCHVMERESFEDDETAAILNDYFVSIKVDREERPDLDRIYMMAVQAMTGSGGWPLNVVLTPDLEPFYGGTYFPPERRQGMAAFRDVLMAVAEAWEYRRAELAQNGRRVVAGIAQQTSVVREAVGEDLQDETLSAAVAALWSEFDRMKAGWGPAPKFPQAMVLDFLLRYYVSTGNTAALSMVTQTLEAMARGGTFDQLGGGFHRYSVDRQWVVPHFEKMLYDNALLSRVYLHAWQVTGQPLFRAVCEETLDYVLREMTDASGGFYSSQDADTEGVEGKYYVWTTEEIEDVLEDDADGFIGVYGVSRRGNFEGRNILMLRGGAEERQELAEARRRLLDSREQRVRPGRDEKVLASWNGLMLAAFAEAAQALGRDDYRQAAERNADFLLREMRQPDGKLWHTWKDGQAKVSGYLDDYTHVSDGLIELYETTFDPKWYAAARDLVDRMVRDFAAPAGFFDTSDDHGPLVARTASFEDNALPSGNSMAAFVLLRLSALGAEPHYADLARRGLRQAQPLLNRQPLGLGQWLTALDLALADVCQVAVVGDPSGTDAQALVGTCRREFRPHQVVAAGIPGDQNAPPVLSGREQVQGRATGYVCAGSTCLSPTTDAAQLGELLRRHCGRSARDIESE